MATSVSMGEVRKTIATSLGAAFGFIIALTWNSVVLGALAAADVPLGATVGVGWVNGSPGRRGWSRRSC